MTPFTLPADDYPCIKRVNSFQELITTPFANGINAFCWERTLRGDFGEVVKKLSVSEGITALDEALLLSLPVSNAGRAAIDQLLEDLRFLG